ncbi:MAG TPA: hypothetical protein VMX38_08605 [Verrucomicrobiae bacterium]|jgi:hypothetical protein|nr:hypothetical protein [Verrucomicrobiae bacterium]
MGEGETGLKARNRRGGRWAVPVGIVLLSLIAVGAWGQESSTPATTLQSEHSKAEESSSSLQSLPEAPLPPQQQEKQGESTADKTKDITKDITKEAEKETEKLGTVTLDKLEGWERGWLTGPYTSRRGRLVPFTDEQRKQIYLQQTLTTPSAYVKRMFVAGGDQIRDSPAGWGEGWGAYGERFASREGQFITANSVAALGNWKLKYDPLYDQCKCEGFGARTKHAIVRSFLTYNRTERELRPQWALFGGAFAGGVVSSTWKPRPQNFAANGAYAVLGQAGYGALLNFFIEFAGDMNRKMDAWRERHGRR